MNSKDNLIGKVITVFLSGGWELSGEVKSLDDNKFIIENDGDLSMVFKDKISCLIISKDARVLRPPEFNKAPDNPRPTARKAPAESDASSLGTFPMNGIAYSESGMSIPTGLLEKEFEDTGDDLSIFFPRGNGAPGDGGEKDDRIEFGVEDDSTNKD